jgi:hypothetical protein
VTALPCATSPERTAMFVGDGPKDDRESNWRYARQLCRSSCPVLEHCRTMVLTDEANGMPHIGVAGGLHPDERDAAWRADLKQTHRHVAECGTESGAKRHKNRGENVCSDCRRAVSEADKRRRSVRGAA